MSAPPDQPPSLPPPIVSTRGDRRTLEFTPGDIQSEMRLSRPDALVLSYARAMMCFALLAPRPRHILMVGLGGGSLAKFCHRRFPAARITVLEVRADVIALREQFRVPPDDARLRVLHCDAADWLAGAMDGEVDVLLVDGFDAAGLPPGLSSASFYTHCRRALRPGGVLVANIFTYDPGYVTAVQRLQAAFDGQVCWLSGIAGNNQILLAQCAPHPGAAPGRALRFLRDTLRNRGLGAGPFNRLLARLLVAWLSWRRHPD
ncbi:transferase spermidine synthase [Massilia sp. BSC265]|uniref:spermine/spermidine synthase domain-containing protein n=1 Tax=Massilia sp. BSC265 TaxID=1549812 RepID=UPI0004E91161|nr:transferase spermidine synthase [Massilia sp. BSC265]KFI05776.1 transferase spermidine synthase [Massilia sp. BSC265]